MHVGGVTAGYDDFAEIIVGKLPLFVGVVIGLGCLLLLLAFRSIGIPLKAAAMNVAAVASSFGVVVAIFQWGWGSELLGLGRAGPIEPFLPVIMVSVLFGLSMDYQVFLVSRMYEEWLETGDNRRAVRVGLAETSRVINSAAVIMISVFLAFVLSGDRVIAMFGIAPRRRRRPGRLRPAYAAGARPDAHAGRRQLVAAALARPQAAAHQHRAPGSRSNPCRRPCEDRGHARQRDSHDASADGSAPDGRRSHGCSRYRWARAPSCGPSSRGRPRSSSAHIDRAREFVGRRGCP